MFVSTLKHFLILILFITLFQGLKAQRNWFVGVQMDYPMYHMNSYVDTTIRGTSFEPDTTNIETSVTVLPLPILPSFIVGYEFDSTFRVTMGLGFKSLALQSIYREKQPTGSGTIEVSLISQNTIQTYFAQPIVHARLLEKLYIGIGFDFNQKVKYYHTETLVIASTSNGAVKLAERDENLNTLWIQGMLGANYEIRYNSISFIPSVRYYHSLNRIRNSEQNDRISMTLQSFNIGVDVVFPL